VNTQTIYIVLKSTYESQQIIAPEPARGTGSNGQQQQKIHKKFWRKNWREKCTVHTRYVLTGAARKPC